MKQPRKCDFNGCETKPVRFLGTRGIRWMSSYEDEIELCQKHYIETLEWFYSKSTGQRISQLIKEMGE